MIMLLTCVQAVRIEAPALPDVNHRSTLMVLPSAETDRSIGRWVKSLFRVPRGPFTTTFLVLTVTVTPSGTVTVSLLRMVFMV